MSRISFRNLRRPLFATIAITSLVLCLATVGLWVRSYWVFDSVSQMLEPFVVGHYYTSKAGDLVVRRFDRFGTLPGRGRPRVPQWQYRPTTQPWTVPASHSFLGFGYDKDVEYPARNYSTRRLAFTIPHWSLALLFAIVPTWWLTTLVRARRRAQPGCCARCGYDLRATPERCPECGAGTSAVAMTAN